MLSSLHYSLIEWSHLHLSPTVRQLEVSPSVSGYSSSVNLQFHLSVTWFLAYLDNLSI